MSRRLPPSRTRSDICQSRETRIRTNFISAVTVMGMPLLKNGAGAGAALTFQTQTLLVCGPWVHIQILSQVIVISRYPRNGRTNIVLVRYLRLAVLMLQRAEGLAVLKVPAFLPFPHGLRVVRLLRERLCYTQNSWNITIRIQLMRMFKTRTVMWVAAGWNMAERQLSFSLAKKTRERVITGILKTTQAMWCMTVILRANALQ